MIRSHSDLKKERFNDASCLTPPNWLKYLEMNLPRFSVEEAKISGLSCKKPRMPIVASLWRNNASTFAIISEISIKKEKDSCFSCSLLSWLFDKRVRQPKHVLARGRECSSLRFDIDDPVKDFVPL